jgi:hypothetical protein
MYNENKHSWDLQLNNIQITAGIKDGKKGRFSFQKYRDKYGIYYMARI